MGRLRTVTADDEKEWWSGVNVVKAQSRTLTHGVDGPTHSTAQHSIA